MEVKVKSIVLFLLSVSLCYSNIGSVVVNSSKVAIKYATFKKKKLNRVRVVPDSVMYYAKKIEKEYGISSQVIITISAWETGWWKSNLCVKYNNYFGISKGKKEIGLRYSSIKECFDHFVKLITTKKWYKKAYENRYNIVKFVDNLYYWNPSGSEYTERIKKLVFYYQYV